MRIAFVGLPIAALLLLADGHEVVIAGVRTGLTTGARRLRRWVGDDRVVLDPHLDWQGFRQQLQRLHADLLVSWFFTRRISMEVVNACPLRGIGAHPSLLPRHRGPDPFFAAIDAGDAYSGVTVHRLEAAYDTGAILAQQRVAIASTWNAWQLAKALDRPSLSLLRDVVRRAAQGEGLEGEPQDEAQATDAPFPTEEQRMLQWNLPAQRIVRRIRALAPTPGALAFAGEVSLVVQQAEVRPVHAVLRPGEAAIMDGVAVVRAADDGVALLRGEVAGQRWTADLIAHQIASGRSK